MYGMKTTKLRSVAIVACVLLVGTHAFAFDIGLSAGIDGSFDVHTAQTFVSAEAYAAARADGDVRLSRSVTLDNRTLLRAGVDIDTAAVRGLASSETGLTVRAAPFTIRIANDTVGQLTSDGFDDYLTTDLTGRLAWGRARYSLFLEPGVKWAFDPELDLDRRARTGFSALVLDNVIAGIVGEVGDRRSDVRYQTRITGDGQLDWYIPGPATLSIHAGVGRFDSDDRSELNGEQLPIWSYTQMKSGAEVTFQTSPSSRLGLQVPLTVRWYDHNYVGADGELGNSTQRSTGVIPDLSYSVWPTDTLELRTELGARITRSNTPALEETRLRAGVSAHLSF